MANPNLTALASLYGKASYLALTTSTQNLISNPLNSNQIFKINIISVTNTASYPVIVTLQTIRSNTIVEITSNIVIPPQTTVKLNNKNNFMYLEEGDTVQMYANANSAIQAVTSYEILSSVLPDNSGTTYSFNYLPPIIYEGTRYTIIINTTGVTDGTTLYWTNSGNTVAADFTSSANSGNFVVRNNTGFFNIVLTSDSTTETGETVILQIRTGSTTGTIVATSNTIQVADAP